jgi:hypothetical protein
MPKLKAKSKKKKEKEPKYYWQWYWDHDYLGNKYKAIYFGPKLDWMHLSK